MKCRNILAVPLLVLILFSESCEKPSSGISIQVFPDSVLSDVSNHPIGINLDYFTDDDHYLKPARRTADALKDMGVKYLRYPGGNKSDFYFFSVPPYEESVPTLARTGKGAVGGRHKMLKNYSEYTVDVLDFDEFMEMCKEIGAEPAHLCGSRRIPGGLSRGMYLGHPRGIDRTCSGVGKVCQY